MKPKRGLLGISVLAVTISLSPFAFAQEDAGQQKDENSGER